MSVLQQDIVGLEVPMHHAERVCEGERIDDFAQNSNHLVDRATRRAA